MPYWEITPHSDSDDADSCIMPADRDEDHNAALDYATDRLGELWDLADEDVTYTVTITLRSGPMPTHEPNPE